MLKVLLVILFLTNIGYSQFITRCADEDFIPGCGTGTCSAGIVTINAESGVITSETLTALSQTFEEITLNDNLIKVESVIIASLYNETNLTGIPVLVLISQTDGAVRFRIYNAHTLTAFSGTVKIYFLILSRR